MSTFKNFMRRDNPHVGRQLVNVDARSSAPTAQATKTFLNIDGITAHSS
jgi:hypothetical protein